MNPKVKTRRNKKIKDKNSKNKIEKKMMKEITIIRNLLVDSKRKRNNSSPNEILSTVIIIEEMTTIILTGTINRTIKAMDIIITIIMGIRILVIKLNNSITMNILVIMIKKKRIIDLEKSLENGIMNRRMNSVKISFKKDIIIMKNLIIVNKCCEFYTFKDKRD